MKPVENIREKILSYFSDVRPQWGRLLNEGRPFTEISMDSLQAVRFIAFLQKSFAVRIYAEEYLDGNSFRDLNSLCELISRKRSGS